VALCACVCSALGDYSPPYLKAEIQVAFDSEAGIIVCYGCGAKKRLYMMKRAGAYYVHAPIIWQR
jgi:hypothetical protein